MTENLAPASWDSGLALHQAVLDACDRITDRGLRTKVLIAEAGHLAARLDTELTRERFQQRRRAEAIAQICLRPWRDSFGALHCPSCGGFAEPAPHGGSGHRCTCPRVVESQRAGAA